MTRGSGMLLSGNAVAGGVNEAWSQVELSPTSGYSPLFVVVYGLLGGEDRPEEGIGGGSGMEFLTQPIRRTAVLEEINSNEVPVQPLHYPAVATVADQLPPWRRPAPTARSVRPRERLTGKQSMNRKRPKSRLDKLTRKLLDGREGSGSELPLLEPRGGHSRRSAVPHGGG